MVMIVMWFCVFFMFVSSVIMEKKEINFLHIIFFLDGKASTWWSCTEE